MGRRLEARLEQVRCTRGIRDTEVISGSVSAARGRIEAQARRAKRMSLLPPDAAERVVEIRPTGKAVELVARDASAGYWLDRWLRGESSSEFRRSTGGRAVRVVKVGGRDRNSR